MLRELVEGVDGDVENGGDMTGGLGEWLRIGMVRFLYHRKLNSMLQCTAVDTHHQGTGRLADRMVLSISGQVRKSGVAAR
jgi:hypothetical protein